MKLLSYFLPFLPAKFAKRSFALHLILLLIVSGNADAQTRYKDLVFPSVNSIKDIQFGSGTGIDNASMNLFLDFYEPQNDTAALRPLVIFIHGGSLISGTRGAMDYFCIDFAKRGYAAATIDYRLGIQEPKSVKTILEALLRGVQDTKAAVRYLRANYVQYGIDTSKIYLAGSSAGSMIAVHYAYWDQDEIPSDVDQLKWGDIEGTGGTPGFSSAVNGIVNYCGAILDPSWIDAGEPAVANFHGLLDPVVPPDDGISTDFGIRIHGGVSVGREAVRLGIYNHNAFFPNMSHGGNEDSLRVFSANFIYSHMIISSASVSDFSSLLICAKTLKVFRYDDFTFTASANHKGGSRIILPVSMLQYSCGGNIGKITPTGIFTPGSIPGSGYVYVNFAGSKDSCLVTTYDLKYFKIKPHTAVTDTARPLRINIDTYDADSLKHDLAITKFILSSTVPPVGTIDSTGLFHPKKNGTTKIIAWCSGFTDTCTISVESASGIMGLDAFESLEGWTFEGTNLDMEIASVERNQKSEGNNSLKLEYRYTHNQQTPNYYIYLYKELPVYGIPDSIYLDVKSDGQRHKLYYRFSDANGNLFRASGKRYLNDSLAFAVINTPMTGLAPVSVNTEPVYPLTLTRIEIQLAGSTSQGSVNSGRFYIDNLRFKYPGEGSGVIPEAFYLEQNYPNPFNAGTNIDFNLNTGGRVSLKIYDILGQEVKTLVDNELQPGYHSINFRGTGLPSGIYIYRLETSGFTDVKKMILMK